ncbi:NAD(+) synthase [Tribonema minus]|uniref:Glutamine-dependent NAD(+) synthetase n=1 Tax=Tribonema minus TaxID=303371 RepID=A0A835ZEW9_9STRA|nr:NAD(+) synthase [Tribonema minus]
MHYFNRGNSQQQDPQDSRAVPLVTVSTCNLNQWALDFDGNLERVERSIRLAKEAGARYRLGPELELSGYGCEDHFLEADTLTHCDDSLATILKGDATYGILCDIGLPVMHAGVRYNCRAFCLDGKILLLRPKLFMADDGNYRESRHFTSWKRANEVEDHVLSIALQDATGQFSVPFGHGAVAATDTVVATETCEELWTPRSPHIEQSLAGVEITGNGSASHHELRKLDTRVSYMLAATRKCGGVYLYANQQGCDGGRLYFDGCALIVCNGKLLAQGSQFSAADVEVVTATVNLDDVRAYRAACASRSDQSSRGARPALPLIRAGGAATAAAAAALPAAGALGGGAQPQSFRLATDGATYATHPPTVPTTLKLHTPEEECALGPACWLWDYLRRSRAAGFFLPLSGGADSSSTAVIVGVMCHLVVEAAERGDRQVASDVRRIAGMSSGDPLPSAQALANSLMHTAYMGTANSGAATRRRAAALAGQIGACHSALDIDAAVAAVVGVFRALTGNTPRFASRGGSETEDLALQNIQARLRMVFAYLLAQLLPWARGRPGFLLVLGSANVDESLRGYMTKYDCSSADLNPIGAISKVDLKRMLSWAAERYGWDSLTEIGAAPPTAELRPMEEGADDGGEHSQLDEDDMGMTYEELSHFGRLRKVGLCGPVSMFRSLVALWPALAPSAVAAKVKLFFYFYGVNRHKMTTLTPAYHAEAYSPDDNRFDLRPFLYNMRWPRQFRDIDAMAGDMEAGLAAQAQQQQQQQLKSD